MRELGEVPEEARELAMSRFRLIQPHLEKNQPLQTVAADGKVPFRTAQRWVSQYRKFGLIVWRQLIFPVVLPQIGMLPDP